MKVLYRLDEAGFKAYLVGGGVRDLLLGRQPKDFDISTDAQPREIKRLFRNCFLIGRRFRLAHVIFGNKVVETSTFRKQPNDTVPSADENAPGALYQNSDNTFGTPEEDAKRRDFTVNGLFYDIKTFNIIDYVDGLRDLDQRLLRSIGDPNVRFREDPVRMMRAVRLAARLDMTIERKTYRAICVHHAEIAQASTARVLEEIFRLFTFSNAAKTFKLLWETRLLASLLPDLDSFVKHSGREKSPLWACLEKMDELEQQNDRPFANGFHLAVLFFPLFQAALDRAGQSTPGDINSAEIAEQCLADFNSRFKPPKEAYYHALHLLDDQQRFEALPAPGRRIRPSRTSEFADALRLARIRLALSGGSTKMVDAWQKLMPDASRPEQPHAERSRRSPRPAAAKHSESHPTAAEKSAENQPDETDPAEDAAPAASSRRRKRRGGRRHRSKEPANASPQAAADTPVASNAS